MAGYSVLLSWNITLNISISKLGVARFEPVAVGSEAGMLPLCYNLHTFILTGGLLVLAIKLKAKWPEPL